MAFEFSLTFHEPLGREGVTDVLDGIGESLNAVGADMDALDSYGSGERVRITVAVVVDAYDQLHAVGVATQMLREALFKAHLPEPDPTSLSVVSELLQPV